jgi:hypothetical protein
MSGTSNRSSHKTAGWMKERYILSTLCHVCHADARWAARQGHVVPCANQIVRPQPEPLALCLKTQMQCWRFRTDPLPSMLLCHA